MSQQATEIAYLPLKGGLDLQSGEAKNAWDSALSTIAKQPGLKSLFWGLQIENKDVVQMVVDWESFDAHKTFMESPAYQPFLENLGNNVLGGAPTLFHAKFPANTSSPNPLSAPVTECVSAYFSPDQPEDEYSNNFSTFKAEAAKIPNIEAKGLMGGWSIEPHQQESLGEGVEGKMFAAFIGWPTVEAHAEFRKTEEFGKIIPYLRGGTKGIKVWHVAFQQYK